MHNCPASRSSTPGYLVVRKTMKTNDQCRMVEMDDGKDDDKSPRTPFGPWAESPSPSVCADEDGFPGVEDFFQFDLSAREGVEYFPGSDCPVDGWFQPCKSCNEMTANVIEPEPGLEVSVCRRCIAKDMFRLNVSECSTSAPQQAEMRTPPSSPQPEQCANDGKDDPITQFLYSEWDAESEIDWTCWLGLADDSSKPRRRNTVCHGASSGPFDACMSPSMSLIAPMAITA